MKLAPSLSSKEGDQLVTNVHHRKSRFVFDFSKGILMGVISLTPGSKKSSQRVEPGEQIYMTGAS